ncbi:FAD-dependent oxidoreductase [Rhodocaloribacter litoris]|uniref:FAD-dependent oxidoreductase n=1 Tax=Rhodocaloribacter litoris TaxID=2558931 RepID=UPI00141E714B|nr:FAD-dependent oxidoreductase [Rhodocaloribacter litoris]QXD16208.1 FAD-dependent oxidoreductase [Rhodocaloribacter litoris]
MVYDPEAVVDEHFDVAIIGGGIYGVMLLSEATRAGYRAVLIERDDFGAATSSNHFRILHGGLRYLQTLDVARSRMSVRERRWFLRKYPDLVEPLRCVMPLYGEGFLRPLIMRTALWFNDSLAVDRNRGVRPDRHLPSGTLLSPEAVREIFPVVPATGLKAAAVWYDARMLQPNQILRQVLAEACTLGARALSHMEVTEVVVRDGVVQGVRFREQQRGLDWQLFARVVLNAAGPWSPLVATRAGVNTPDLCRPLLAWNVRFDHPALGGKDVLAVKPPGRGRRTYFLTDWEGRLAAGTGYAVRNAVMDRPEPTTSEMQAFLDDLNAALPALRLSASAIDRVYAGYVPAGSSNPSEPSTRPVLVDHGRQGGAQGFISVVGVKYTTARAVAERVVQRLVRRYVPDPPRGRVGSMSSPVLPSQDLLAETGDA